MTKALTLFGDPAHERILVAFLNAVLTPSAPITRAIVRNPFHPAQFEDHKSLILDIQAQDEAGRTFQVEMQRQNDRGLCRRMLYGWARLYSEQLSPPPWGRGSGSSTRPNGGGKCLP